METTIADLNLTESDVLRYLFDSGDNWNYPIEVRETRGGTLDGTPTIVEIRGVSAAVSGSRHDLTARHQLYRKNSDGLNAQTIESDVVRTSWTPPT